MNEKSIFPASRKRRLLDEPDPDCNFCPRLTSFRHSLRATQPDWHNAPVPVFGALDARLLVVGLAPGLRGANRTGRPFTGDFAGDLLYKTLIEYGFATGTYGAQCDDGLRLVSCAITNAVRCVPPQNKPVPTEINSCRPFLVATIGALPNLCAIVALGRVAHRVRCSCLRPKAHYFSIYAWRRTRLGCHTIRRSGRNRLSRKRKDDYALRQLSLFPLQHEYRGADARDVSSRFRQGPRKALTSITYSAKRTG